MEKEKRKKKYKQKKNKVKNITKYTVIFHDLIFQKAKC